MNKKKLKEIIDILFEHYPEPKCALDFSSPFELMVASRLSAQCTDKRVNVVTPVLFKKYRTVDDFANADQKELENIIFSCGLYKTKARDIIAMAKAVQDEKNIPTTFDGFLALPGVGRKIANLLMGEIYGDPSVVITDTHCIRLANRIGLATSDNPYIVEKELKKILPPNTGFRFSHTMVNHGRNICTSQSPKCDICPIAHLCEKRIKKEINKCNFMN